MSIIQTVVRKHRIFKQVALTLSVTSGIIIGDCLTLPAVITPRTNSARAQSTSNNIWTELANNGHSPLLWYSTSFAIASTISASTPIIFNSSISGNPGDVIGLQGAGFGSSPQVFLSLASNSAVPLATVNQGNNYIAAKIPADQPFGLYALQVFDGTNYSKTVYLNQAHAMSFDTPEIAANGAFRIFGRNLLLPGASPTVKFVDPSTGVALSATVVTTGSDAYVLKAKAPSQVNPGVHYDVYVSNGYGGVAGKTKADETLVGRKGGVDKWKLGVAWAADYDFYNNVYNLKTDPRLQVHAVGDGLNNDQPAIQQAINLAARSGGGVVYLPAGTYRLATSGQGLLMASRVVLAGESTNTTTINFGYGQPHGEAGIWWPDGTTVSGIVDLTYRNVNEGGHWQSNFGAGQSSELFIQRARLELNSAGGIFWSQIPKMVLENTTINQSCDPLNQNGGPWHFDGNRYFVIRGNHITACDQYGINFAEDGVIELNHLTRNAQVYVPGRNLVANFTKNIIITNNTFDLINGPDKVNNDGETILSEGGGAQRVNDAGVTTDTSANTLQDSSKHWSQSQFNSKTKHPVVVIVSGEGAGQWREITSNNSTTLTVDRAWDVAPAIGSHYAVIAWSAVNWLIKGNTLQDHARGIQFYDASSLDLAVVGNQMLNNGAIWLRGNQDFTNSSTPQFDLIYHVQVIGNTLTNTRVATDKSQGQGAFIAVQPGLVRASSIFGTSALGIEIKGNSINGIVNAVYSDGYQDGYYNNTYSFQPASNFSDGGIPSILGTILQDNTCKSCTSVFNLNGGAYRTVIWNSRHYGPKLSTRDTFLDGTVHRSVGTVVGP
ncbi:MAG: hypothetical protein H0X31_11985 [Nostocaceae cyanobacterium]|nr:hypothetical protein [Nostocaceae cyanobacterium]